MNRPRHVLHVITRLIVGGAQENTLITVEALNSPVTGQGRYTAQVVSGVQTGPEGSLIEEAARRAIPLQLMPCLRRELNPPSDIIALLKLLRLMKDKKGKPVFDIVHTHSSKAGILGRLAARLAHVPVIVHTVHGWSFHDHMPCITKNIYVALERWSAGFTNKLIVVTERDIAKGLRKGIGRPDQYVLIRSGIELDRFKPMPDARRKIREHFGIPPDAPVIGSVTRLSAQKAPLDLVEAFGIIAGRKPQSHLLVVGDGPLRKEVETKLSEFGLQSRVALTGLRRDIPELLNAMDVFVLTSRWEGLPRVIPQAMACGLPVVVTDADGSGEAVIDGKTGFVVRQTNVNALAERIMTLLENPQKARRMGAAGREMVAEYDATAMTQKIVSLYDDLCLF